MQRTNQIDNVKQAEYVINFRSHHGDYYTIDTDEGVYSICTTHAEAVARCEELGGSWADNTL